MVKDGSQGTPPPRAAELRARAAAEGVGVGAGPLWEPSGC